MDNKELEHRLDRLCSTYVRCRDKRCFTCGKFLWYDQRQAGHYLSRAIKAERWDIVHNLRTQCNRCNVELGGNLRAYADKLEKTDPVGMNILCQAYRLYNNGDLPEPTHDEKVHAYNKILQLLRTDYPKRAQQFAEWQELQ